MISIYHLIDPGTGVVRYVGKSKNPKNRLRAHIKESLARQNTRKKRWIYNLHNQNLQPILAIVAQYADDAAARIRESAECQKHLSTIYNIHDPNKKAPAFAAKLKAEKDSEKKVKKT